MQTLSVFKRCCRAQSVLRATGSESSHVVDMLSAIVELVEALSYIDMLLCV